MTIHPTHLTVYSLDVHVYPKDIVSKRFLSCRIYQKMDSKVNEMRAVAVADVSRV